MLGVPPLAGESEATRGVMTEKDKTPR
ncbi:MAG: hypothetical protein QOK18_4878, partial [Mycobacterium sp.]|nr:hypothetical protein [Mycobacterium sp.]